MQTVPESHDPELLAQAKAYGFDSLQALLAYMEQVEHAARCVS